MSELIMKFKLPEEQDECNVCSKGPALFSAMWDVYQLLRQELKYNDKLGKKQREIVGKLYDDFWKIIQDKDLGGMF